MTQPSLRIENLGKRYRIGSLAQKHDTLRDAIAAPWKNGWRQISTLKTGQLKDDADKGSPTHIWALQDVSVQIHQGEVVGIIGRNGAGKTTLLKLLAKITEPTRGRAWVYGRVGSLLEVGTGFHPELTGRENIFLNGAILGMKRAEIKRRFDKIVEFAEIGPFLDTPVKRYSSGMYVRLAFAVAAHLEPEILFVDEVLSVGDAAFQKKCLGKMDDISHEGRTILFVSHNLNAVQRLCSRGLLLNQGRLEYDGDISNVVSKYMASTTGTNLAGENIELFSIERRGNGRARFSSACFFSGQEEARGFPTPNGPLSVELMVEAKNTLTTGSLAVTIYDVYGTKLINADTISLGLPITMTSGVNRIQFGIDHLYLNPGIYSVGLWMADSTGDVIDHINPAFRIEVVDSGKSGLGARPLNDGAVPCEFTIRRDI